MFRSSVPEERDRAANCHLPVWILELPALLLVAQTQNDDNVGLICSKSYFAPHGVISTEITGQADPFDNFMKITLCVLIVR